MRVNAEVARGVRASEEEAVDLPRRLVAEGLGTALLVAAVVGSGLMAQGLTTDVGLALLANTLATAGALIALLLVFGPVSGAQFNPVVTATVSALGDLRRREAIAYAAVQTLGAVVGAIIANVMFDQTPLAFAHNVRDGGPRLFSEAIATFGLIGVVISVGRNRPAAMPFAVAAYITAAYWFTASTSFANPAVTVGRMFADSFAGIRPVDVPGFIAAQLVGALAGAVLFHWLVPRRPLLR